MAELRDMTERDLLILINQRVESIEKQLDNYSARVQKLELRMAEIETKIKIWAGIAALIGSAAMSIAHLIFK